jgi:hypothetical protein
VNGTRRLTRRTVGESKYGQMAQDMMAFGRMISLKDMADLSMSRVTFMKDNGKMIRLMALESIRIAMATDTLETGRRTNSTARVWKFGLTTLNTTAITNLA